MGDSATEATMDYSKLKRADLITIRGMVLKDAAALEKWLLVVDDIVTGVTAAVDVLKINKSFKNFDFEEGVIQSLYIWHAYGDQGADLLKVLRNHGLNTLANNILKEIVHPLPDQRTNPDSALVVPKRNELVLTKPEDQLATSFAAIAFNNRIPYSVHGFNQQSIDRIIAGILHGQTCWYLDTSNREYCNQVLVNLVKEYDMSQVLPYVRYMNNPSSVFNTVGQWAVLAKIAENANNEERNGAVGQASRQWTAIEAVLNHASQRGIEYCSLIRGWDQSTKSGAAQGDQILKILCYGHNLNANRDVKDKIFKLIAEEAKKDKGGSLYDLYSGLENNGNVQVAVEKHVRFVREELQTICTKFYSLGEVEAGASGLSSPQPLPLNREHFNPPPGTGRGNLSDSNNFSMFLAQAHDIADRVNSKPDGINDFLIHAMSILAQANNRGNSNTAAADNATADSETKKVDFDLD